MKFLVEVPNFGRWSDPHVFADFAREVEQAGWDGLAVWDHILGGDDLEVADPWVLLTAAAIVTERIRLMTMVTPLPRRHPWKLARDRHARPPQRRTAHPGSGARLADRPGVHEVRRRGGPEGAR